MGILDQSNKCNCSCDYSSTTETADSGYCCNITPDTVETSSSSVGVGSSSSSCTTCVTPTPDSGYCCNITPQSSIDDAERRRRSRRRGR